MRNIKIGIEIECIYNGDILDIERGGYHQGIDLPNTEGWKAEADSSVRHENEFPFASPVELVSKVYKTKASFFRGLEEFKSFFSEGGNYELNEVISFNESCGSHVHFDFENKKFGNRLVYDSYPKIRRYFAKKIKDSNIESKKEILKQYGRRYSKKIKRFDSIKNRERSSEFNFRSEDNGKGLEWRSPNMTGIKTWKEFFEFWEIIFSCLKVLASFTKRFNENFEIEIVDIKDNKKSCERKHYCFADYKNIKPVVMDQEIKINKGGVENVQLEYTY